MSVFEQTAAYNDVTSLFLTALIEAHQGYRKPAVIIEKIQQQLLISDDLLAALDKQKPTASTSADVKSTIAAMKGAIRKYVAVLNSIVHGLNTKTLAYGDMIALVQKEAVPTMQTFAGMAIKYAPDAVDHDKLDREVAEISREKEWHAALKHYQDSELKRKAAAVRTQELASTYIERVKDAQAKQQLESLLPYAAKLPTTLHGRKFDMVRMPIVPYMNFKLLSRALLKKLEIDALFIGTSFVIFKDQVLLAFDVAVLKEEHLSTPRLRRGEIAPAISAKKAKENKELIDSKMEEVVLEAVNTINRVSPQKYVLASSEFNANPHKSNIYFAWLLPRETYALFAQFSGGGTTLSHVDWGFPWSGALSSVL
jgi:hypothetical protein